MSSSLSSPPQLLEGPNSSLSVVKSAREMCCAGQTQAALKELHNPLLNLQYVAKPLHLVDWSMAPQIEAKSSRPSHIPTGVSSWAPSNSPRILAAVSVESVGLLSKEVEVERSAALIDIALAACSFSAQNCSLQCDSRDLAAHRLLSVKRAQLGAQNNCCYLGLNFKNNLLFHTVWFIFIYPRQ